MSGPSRKRTYWVYTKGDEILKQIEKKRNDIQKQQKSKHYGGGSAARDAEQLKKLMARKWEAIVPIVYQEKSLFRKEKALSVWFFYEEEGVFYEFFSKEKYGTLVEEGCERYIKSPYRDVLLKTYRSVYDYANQVDAEEFASQIEVYLPEREKIAAAVKVKLALIAGARAEAEEAKAWDLMRKDRARKKTEDWLDELIG